MVDFATEASAFRKRVGAPAVGVALVSEDGVEALQVDGVRSVDSSDPVHHDDAWHIGSCTKSITALLWARLVERGDAAWDIPLPELFPDVECHIAWHDIDITQLLQCRAGIPANLGMRDMIRAHDDTSPLAEQRTQLAEQLLADAPSRPGWFEYSNLSYVLAGAAIERVAGIDYELAIGQEIMKPLCITNFGFGGSPDISGHRRRFQLGMKGFGAIQALGPASPRNDNPAILTPAGRLHLPLAEWAKFVQVFLNAGAPLVGSYSLDHLTAFPSGGNFAMGWGKAEEGRLAMQGSNTMNAATVVVNAERTGAALVVANNATLAILKESVPFLERILGLAR